MTRALTLGLLALLFLPTTHAQQVTGLDGWELFLDPGHSQTENQGIYGYSEAEKVLRVSLALRDMLLDRTDIDTVYTSRTSDTQSVSLSQRTDRANALGADFFHSIHSNAGAPGTNNVLMLYGGWRQNGQTVEKTPEGGARMGDEYVDAQVEAMRLPTIGNYADRTFYQGFPDNHDNQFPYLFVNRTSAMASVLSESGFHTNPRQNTLNMNADWKRLEAQSFYWGILDWHGVPRSTHRIATGIVTDAESGRPINGATVTVDGQTYTTDTYESLFYRYSDDPDELANGFYYLEDVSAGTHTVTVEAEGYATATAEVTMRDTTFTFADVALVSTVPPVVVDARPEAGEDGFPITDPIRLTLSRPLDPATAGPAFSLVPTAGGDPVAGEVTFERNGFELVFTPDAALEPRTDYTLTLSASATTQNGSPLDGDGDGTGGDDFVLTFISSFPDVAAPRLVSGDPAPNARDAEIRPVVTVAFDEVVVPETLDGRVTLETLGGEAVPGEAIVSLAGVVGETPSPRTTVSFVPDADLAPGTSYRFAIEPGVEDRFGNASAARYAFTFGTGDGALVDVLLDDFEGTSIADDWWVPQQSGSTSGIVTDSTSVSASPLAYPLGGETSMRIDFGWAEGGDAKLIRECFGGCSPGHSFTEEATLRARVYGDGTGVLFRFAVDDGTSGIEVSPWTAVDWYGWKTVTWDLDADGFGTWIGNGAWDSPSSLRMESLQLGYDGEGPRFGAILVDDLAYLRAPGVAADGGPDAGAPLRVDAVWPNPARASAQVRVSLGAAASVTAEVFNAIGQRVAVLADGDAFGAGSHDLGIAAGDLAAGVYVVRVRADGEQAAVTFVVAR
ncbi:Ig-like domain-containing protein [Rubrivirga marina]|uniref:N-acetylmuramoyl-L-alanine amidase n=1 Tax=Rubrivirga marina TaxID=1196024 RepID=A0A271J4F3_9BACT|nr:Ig-like domain-containing protein [Rubrivirga marina]PAP78323.1 hypothetical protein BSZ37_18800 [Rubrivirga marina]